MFTLIICTCYEDGRLYHKFYRNLDAHCYQYKHSTDFAFNASKQAIYLHSCQPENTDNVTFYDICSNSIRTSCCNLSHVCCENSQGNFVIQYSVREISCRLAPASCQFNRKLSNGSQLHTLAADSKLKKN